MKGPDRILQGEKYIRIGENDIVLCVVGFIFASLADEILNFIIKDSIKRHYLAVLP
jgi:hypothetical protein